MKKVLYLTSIEVPYRVRFFNELAKQCDLTVLYEKRSVESRNEIWARSAEKAHKKKFLRREGTIFTGVLKELRREYDAIIVGCYNSPVQMIAQLYMRLCKIPYIVNLDGETFLTGKGIKTRLKKFFLSGADKYLVAGEKAAKAIEEIAGDKNVIPYYFSSLTEEELMTKRNVAEQCKRNKTILVVAQYLEVKGLDVIIETAWKDSSFSYKLIGMGNKTEQFLLDYDGKIPGNVEIIPFLQKAELEKEYQTCGMLVLPSRQECWGLVINEAAAFGMPIVSTWGSGAAVEFLADMYPQYLAKPGDVDDLYRCIQRLIEANETGQYSRYLLEKSGMYSIEKSVMQHVQVI